MSVAVHEHQHERYRRSLQRELARLRRWVWLEETLVAAGRSLSGALLLSFLGALALVVEPLLLEPVWLGALAVVGLMAGVLWSVLHPPSLQRAARLADRRLGLAARLGTAVELEQGRLISRLRPLQIADAARAVAQVRGGWPSPLRTAWREGAVAAALAAALLLVLQLRGMGVGLQTTLPEALRTALGSETTSEERQQLPTAETGNASEARAAAGGQEATNPTLQLLDDLQAARASGALSDEDAKRLLDQAEAQLQQQGQAAQTQRAALDRLASALAQSSASEGISDSLRKGDYERAAQQLTDLARESDQLSPEARRVLSEALRRAAADSAANPTLAQRERRAADALAGRDYQGTRAALEALAQEVARAGQQTGDQSELADALQRLQQERAASGQASSEGERTVGDQGEATTTASTGGMEPDAGEAGAQSSAGSPGQTGDAGSGADQASAGGAGQGAGGGTGGSAPRLEVAGRPVDVPVRPGGGERGLSTSRPGDQEQVVDQASVVAQNGGQPAGPVRADGQVEHVVVPYDQRQVVRDYFGGQRGGRTP